MATVTAFAAAAIVWALPLDTPALAAPAQVPAGQAFLASSGAGASKTDTLPVSPEPGLVTPATRAHSFRDDWYDRIHVMPSVLDLGNILSAQSRPIEVWNAHFAAKLLSAIEESGTQGVILAGPSAAPTTFAALESRTYTAEIALDGPPRLDALYTFAFPDEAPTLAVAGNRVVVFALRPDWSDGITERLAWLTDVMASRAGYEQRAGLRAAPRRALEFDIVAADDDQALLDVLLTGWGARVYCLPLWPEQQRLATPVNAGDTVIALDTTTRTYRLGGLCVLTTDARTHEAAEVASLTAGSITLARPLQSAWPAGTRIAPAHLARLPRQVAITRPAASLALGRMAFAVEDNAAIAAADDALMHKGVAVNTRAPDWSREPQADYARLADIIDWDTGPVAVDDPAGRGFATRQWLFTLGNRVAADAMRQWLHARAGRLTPFWQPLRERNIEVVAAFAASATQIRVRAQGFASFFESLSGRQDIAILRPGKVWSLHRVTGIQAAGAGEELLDLDATVGFDAAPTDLVLVCWAELSRLAADAVEIHWLTDAVAQVQLSTVGVRQ